MQLIAMLSYRILNDQCRIAMLCVSRDFFKKIWSLHCHIWSAEAFLGPQIAIFAALKRTFSFCGLRDMLEML
jgi:hypothetical protein